MRAFSFLAVLIFLVGCADYLPMRSAQTPLPPDAKIFLVAGGHEVANFAQEVIEQRTYFLSLGYSESEIACYYSRPFDDELRRDREQFRSLAHSLASCYPANPSLILSHLNEAGTQDNSWLYLYVTSHGGSPHQSLDLVEQRGWGNRSDIARRFPDIFDYVMHLGSRRDGFPITFAERIQVRLAGANDSETKLFTPQTLTETLNAVSADIRKFVVLQACYSGGFIDDDPDKLARRTTLRDVSNITVLTASTYDRSSFGCDPGNSRTVFGGAITDLIRRENKRIDQIQWEDLYRETSQAVSNEETRREEKSSLPLYFSN